MTPADAPPLLRLAAARKLILDGATGTELNRRGVHTGLPLWSANALLSDLDAQKLHQIHLDYLRAGANLITTNTFRTHRRTLDKWGYGQRARELTHKATQLVRAAIKDAHKEAYVAGSIAPLEDCYTPQLVPSDQECEREHAELVEHLAEANVDLFLIETMNTIREAEWATQAAARIGGIPVAVSFVCDPRGALLSGESLIVAAEKVLALGAHIVGVNCVSTPHVAACLAQLQKFNVPLIAYGNIGHSDERTGWVNTDAVEPTAYARYAQTWAAHIVGGCCGTTPHHIEKLEQVRRQNL